MDAGLSRRDFSKTLITAAAAAGAVTLSPVRDSLICFFSKPGKERGFVRGLDFAAYQPTVWLDGTAVDTVYSWRINTGPHDANKWTTERYANAFTYRPFFGTHALKNGFTLRRIIQSSFAFITETADLFSAGAMQECITRFSLDERHYATEMLREAAAKSHDNDGIDYLLRRTTEHTIKEYERKDVLKRNLSIELDSYYGQSSKEYQERMKNILALKEKRSSDIPVLSCLEDLQLYDEKEAFDRSIKRRVQDADCVILNTSPHDWNLETPKYKNLKDKIRFVKDLVPDKQLYVRLIVGDYRPAKEEESDGLRRVKAFPLYRDLSVGLLHPAVFLAKDDHPARMAYISGDELEWAVNVIRTDADGIFLDDTNGLLLYKTLFTGWSVEHPIDRGVLKDVSRSLYKDLFKQDNR